MIALSSQGLNLGFLRVVVVELKERVFLVVLRRGDMDLDGLGVGFCCRRVSLVRGVAQVMRAFLFVWDVLMRVTVWICFLFLDDDVFVGGGAGDVEVIRSATVETEFAKVKLGFTRSAKSRASLGSLVL